MKSVLISVVSLVMLASVSGYTQRMMDDREIALATPSKKQDEKTKIKKEDLPEAAQKVLEGDAFKGWTIENAYKLSNGEFEVELKKGTTSQTVKFDKDGKVK
ncbi:hypothetical protein WSM22_37030 [Cytophagales bacterium WSM2-2]|nr:hypothetical protein WSM22_37030 [Cytophagales bacterium WSM2-2]